jgi:ubiquinone/menaquinone biosynthesis C-methylase UbiE
MTHENEYPDNLVTLLELIWGEGYMSPGGPGNVMKMLRGLVTSGQRILDIGCGVGGPAFEMVKTYGATVVGIDLEAPLVARANKDADDKGLSDRCVFTTVTRGSLPFDDASFDIVTSCGAITQTPDKVGLLSEALRLLRPGGCLSSYEWMTSGDEFSEDMHHWFKLEELTYEMETLEGYREIFSSAGFVGIAAEDATDWYREEARREYEMIQSDLYAQAEELLGREDADHFLENWRATVVVIDNGEMRQGYCRGRKPE